MSWLQRYFYKTKEFILQKKQMQRDDQKAPIKRRASNMSNDNGRTKKGFKAKNTEREERNTQDVSVGKIIR